MDNNLIYMPTFRVRQQETIVLKSFDFENHIYPLLEIVKEFDRSRNDDCQKTFSEIYLDIIRDIRSQHVFVDLPVYLKQTGSTNVEVLKFALKVLNRPLVRNDYINQLSEQREKIIPVISSYLNTDVEGSSIESQFASISPNFDKVAFRIFPQTFTSDFPIVRRIARETDYIIIDIEQISPYYRSPPLRPLISDLAEFANCCKILLRSALNSEIQNVRLDHGQVVYQADNSQIDTETLQKFSVNAVGDFAGIKKDDLTAGGMISPGFIYYDADENQYYGFKASVKDLNEFEQRIVPDVLGSQSTYRMLRSTPPYLTAQNPGYQTLINILEKRESGKNQAKFKKIAMEHYLFCIREKIRAGQLSQP
jgi:hypothetical protein